ncbi:MAG: PD40 domain-containing protein [Bacteroidales bacterium]|nr:PD40 domain-containing protein [Bacteroidales bacterium]
MRRGLLLLLMLVPAMVWGQGDDCHYKFSGSDKSDFEKGVEAYNNKRYQQCITLMRKVSAKHRTAADPYFYMGVAGVKGGERPAAIRNNFTKLFKYCPDYPNALAYFYMGVVHYTYKEYDKAVEQLNRYFDITNQQPNQAYDAVYEEASTYLYWSEFLNEALQNQVPFFPTVMRGVSSRYDEYRPYLTPDGREMYYLRQVPASKQKTFYNKESDEMVLRLFTSRWKDTVFTSGEELPPPFNEDGEISCITTTADGNLMYLSLMRREKGYANCDIYFSERQSGKWGPLQNAGRNVNGERTWESQPSITADGQYLYFVSNRNGGYGGDDIWYCRRLENGDWSRAENLGPAVNTAGNERLPFIHADGKTLYFASNGWQGFGGYDMYFINLTDTYLQRPTNLGLPINSEENDISFNVTVDGKRGYFAGKSTEWAGIGGNDIFTFELYPAAQPEESAIVYGQMKDSKGNPLTGTIKVLRQKADGDRYIVNGNEGRFALAVAARGDNTVIVDADGFLPRVVCGNAAQLKRDLVAADFTLHPAELWGRYPIPNLNPKHKTFSTILDAYVDYLLEHPKIHIRIESTKLEEAKAIYDYLVSRQLRAERLEYKQNSALAKPQIVITQM